MTTERITEACIKAWIESGTQESYSAYCVSQKNMGRFWLAKETL